MATKITLPMLGETMEEGTILRWLKNEGDTVEKGEPLYEVLTDKVNMEVESPEGGVLRKIMARPDDIVPVFAPVAIIGTADEPIDDLLAEAPAAEQERKAAAPPRAAPSAPAAVPPTADVLASPRARRMASESGIDLSLLAGRGTGPGGRIVEKDVEAYIRDVSVQAAPGTGYRVAPFSGMRRQIADNVTKSAQTIPRVTLVIEVDMTEAVRLHEQTADEFERRHGVRPTFTDLVVRAAALALADHPMVNSSLQKDEIRIFDSVNVGVAIALENGLTVPVVRNAQEKGLPDISVEIKMLAEKARRSGLSSEDVSGGTFTVTNLGAYGVDIFDPIIVAGQTAILGACRIAPKPVVVDGEVAVRSMMNLCLSFDHRVIDGAPAAGFLQDVKRLLESPGLLFA